MIFDELIYQLNQIDPVFASLCAKQGINGTGSPDDEQNPDGVPFREILTSIAANEKIPSDEKNKLLSELILNGVDGYSECAEIINDIAQTLKELPNTQNLSSNQEILLFYLLEARTPNPFTACKRLVEIIEDGSTSFELKRAYNKLTIEEREDVFFAYAAELQHRRKY